MLFWVYSQTMKTVIEHLKDRHVDLELHRPWIDEEERVAVFYLYNQSGAIIGYQQYRPDADKTKNNHPKEARYFTYRKQPTLAVWGLESLHLTPHVVFLTEGIFDAARLTERGYSALAALTNNPTKDLRNWLSMLNRKVVAVCDNDAAGRRLAKFGDVSVFTDDKDLGEADDDFVTTLLRDYA
jgi:DNA primase